MFVYSISKIETLGGEKNYSITISSSSMEVKNASP